MSEVKEEQKKKHVETKPVSKCGMLWMALPFHGISDVSIILQ